MLTDDRGSTWVQPGGGPQQPFASPLEEFQLRLREAWPSQDAEQAVSNAYAAYAAILQEPWQSTELNKRLAEAYELCQKRVREAFAGGNADQVIDAYRRYVRHLKNMWGDLDPESLGPEDLSAIAQGMSWVAGVALEVSAARPPLAEPRS
jgi:hypothetical protein